MNGQIEESFWLVTRELGLNRACLKLIYTYQCPSDTAVCASEASSRIKAHTCLIDSSVKASIAA